MLAVLLALMPVFVILAFRTLCTLKPPPVSAYVKTPVPVPWAPEPRDLPWSWVIGGVLGVIANVIGAYWLI